MHLESFSWQYIQLVFLLYNPGCRMKIAVLSKYYTNLSFGHKRIFFFWKTSFFFSKIYNKYQSIFGRDYQILLSHIFNPGSTFSPCAFCFSFHRICLTQIMLNVLRKFGELTPTEFGRDNLNTAYKVLGHFKRDGFEDTYTEFVCRTRNINLSFPSYYV